MKKKEIYRKIVRLRHRVVTLHWTLLLTGLSLIFIPLGYILYSIIILSQFPTIIPNVLQVIGLALLGINHLQIRNGRKKLNELEEYV